MVGLIVGPDRAMTRNFSISFEQLVVRNDIYDRHVYDQHDTVGIHVNYSDNDSSILCFK